MATRSLIGLKGASGIDVIYCHNDGYPEHNGEILFHHYQSPSKVQALIMLGYISVLGTEIGAKHDFDWVLKIPCEQWGKSPYSKMCRAYGRDRGDRNMKSRHFNTVEDLEASKLFEEYLYLFDLATGKWYWVPTQSDSPNTLDGLAELTPQAWETVEVVFSGSGLPLQ